MNAPRSTLALLILSRLAGAAEAASPAKAQEGDAAPKRQIQISARFLERADKDKPAEVLSSPKVLTQEGQQATIEVGQEIALRPSDDPASAAPPFMVKTGVRMEVTPRISDGDAILLQGRVEVREAPGDRLAKDQLVVSVREVNFNLAVRPGARTEVGGMEQNGRTLTVELLARKIPADNAAPMYWQAFAALPEEPKDKEASDRARWLADAEPALRLLHAAAAKDGCDWDLDYSQGPELTLAHLSKARALSRTALARAEHRAAADPAGAVSDLQAAFRLARHLGVDALLISQLLRVSIEKSAAATAEGLLPQLQPDHIASLRKTLDGLRPAPGLAACLELERTTFMGWLRDKLAASGPEEVLKSLGTLDEKENAWLRKRRTREEIGRLIDATDADYRELVRMATLAHGEFQAAYARWEKQLHEEKQQRILTALIAPALANAAEKFREADQRLEELRTRLVNAGNAGDR